MLPNKILLIVNPVSGRMKSKTGLFEILDELYRLDPPLEVPKATGSVPATLNSSTIGADPASDRRVTVVTTMYRGHAMQLTASAYREGFDTVICCGGDGTLNETISGLLTIPPEMRPTLGYIPAGSTNDFAISLGLPATLRGAARMAVGEAELALDVGCFTPSDSTLSIRHFSYIASFGIFTAASYSTPQVQKNTIGHMAYLLQGVKDLANIPHHKATFALSDGPRLTGDYVFGALTNTTSAAGVFKLPADEVSMTDGLFEVFLVHYPRSVTDLNRIVSALVSGDFATCPLIEFHHTAGVTVTLEEPLSWSLDGEEARGGYTVSLECLPGAVRMKANTKCPVDELTINEDRTATLRLPDYTKDDSLT